jgi:hypothetical protein
MCFCLLHAYLCLEIVGMYGRLLTTMLNYVCPLTVKSVRVKSTGMVNNHHCRRSIIIIINTPPHRVVVLKCNDYVQCYITV